MNLGKALRLSLKEKQISQSELAKRLGISRGTVNKHLHRWEHGETPTLTTLKKWCFILKEDYKKFLNYL